MNNTLCKTEQYFVQYRTILCAMKAAIILCKTLCNVVLYLNTKLRAILFDYIVVQKVVQYLVIKSGVLAMVAIDKVYCKVLHILLNFMTNIGMTWFADAGTGSRSLSQCQ